MGTKQTTIEINGKKYDARTGKLIASASTASRTAKPTPIAAKPAARQKPVMQDIARPAAVSKPARRPVQRSQTLMRSAVKRPAKPATIKATQAKRVTDIAPVRPLPPTQKHASLQEDVARAHRAQKIERSKLVSKFGNSKQTAAHPLPISPVTNRIETMPVRPAPILKPHNPVESILERGLKSAQSHTNTFDKKTAKKSVSKAKKRRSKLATYGAGVFAALLLGGFVAYQNIPNISMRYAANRAGIQATLPGYQPSGFALSNRIQYNPGQITVRFASNSDDREFTITQRETAWNSDALLSNYVSTKTDQVHKYEDKGRTIFLYGNNNATWVNGGVWYDIVGDSHLNSDQLIRIATSM